MGQVRRDRPDHDGTLAEVLDDPQRGLVGIVHPAEDHHELLALGGAQRVHAAGQGRAAYLLEDVRLGALRRDPAQHHRDVPARAPAQGAGTGEHRLVGLGAQDGVHDEGLEAVRPRPPSPPRRGRTPPRWRRRPRGRSGAPPHAPTARRRARRMSSMLASTTSMVSRTEVDGRWRLMAPVSSRGPPRRPRPTAGRAPPPGVAVPVDEALHTGLHDHADPGAVLRAQVVPPGDPGRHRGRGGRAQAARGALEGRPRCGPASPAPPGPWLEASYTRTSRHAPDGREPRPGATKSRRCARPDGVWGAEMEQVLVESSPRARPAHTTYLPPEVR